MIYELAVLARPDLSDEQVSSINQVVNEVMNAEKATLLIQDDWGVRSLAQASSSGMKKGHYLYFMYQAPNNTNKELERRVKLNEGVVTSLIIKIAEDQDAENLVKNFKTPFSKKYRGSVTDNMEEDGDEDFEKDRRKFAKRRNCWFTAKNLRADWKDPNTYAWLINEFGKISPSRVSGINRKNQKIAVDAIKRARVLGIASNLSGRIAE